MLRYAIKSASFQQGGLHFYLNLGTLGDLPETSSLPDVIRQADWDNPSAEAASALKAAGYTGVQGGDPQKLFQHQLGCTVAGEVRELGDLDEWAPKAKAMGAQAMTVHAGWGLESDEQIDTLCHYIIGKSEELEFPISVESHRATFTQDYQRTLELIQRNPAIRINGDFSHWYTGLEMVYGNFEAKLDALEPVFQRVTHLHGRIGTPGMIQAPLQGHEKKEYINHFKKIWTRVFRTFRSQADASDILVFAPELLSPAIYYAPVDQDGNEFSDRWQDALIMNNIAQECWNRCLE